MVYISLNELRFLRELFAELKIDCEHEEISDAITMLDGLMEEGRKVTEARLNQILEDNKELLGRGKVNG